MILSSVCARPCILLPLGTRGSRTPSPSPALQTLRALKRSDLVYERVHRFARLAFVVSSMGENLFGESLGTWPVGGDVDVFGLAVRGLADHEE